MLKKKLASRSVMANEFQSTSKKNIVYSPEEINKIIKENRFIDTADNFSIIKKPN